MRSEQFVCSRAKSALALAIATDGLLVPVALPSQSQGSLRIPHRDLPTSSDVPFGEETVATLYITLAGTPLVLMPDKDYMETD